jgi:release factor glutamine methyltransferase
VDRTWTTLEVLEWTTGRFGRAGIDSPRLDAQVLLAHALGCDRVSLYTSFDKPLGAPELAAFRGLIERRLGGEPVAYLVGTQEFWSLQLHINRSVLVPRRDTETLVQVALDAVDRSAPLVIADVGTGSGAIAIALARELPAARVFALDISAEAAAIARANAASHGVGDRVVAVESDLLAAASGETFDVIAANLPYIPTADIDQLSAEVRTEPRQALDGGADGLHFIRRLITQLPTATRPGALVVFEHGFDQAAQVRDLFLAADLEHVETHPDLGGRDRVTSAKLPG